MEINEWDKKYSIVFSSNTTMTQIPTKPFSLTWCNGKKEAYKVRQNGGLNAASATRDATSQALKFYYF